MMRFLIPLAFSGLHACTPQIPVDAGPPPMSMKVYEVPAGQSELVARTVNNVMSMGEVRHGRALEGPSNTVVVVASAQIHQGVDTLVGSLKPADDQMNAENVEISYWVVSGTPAAKPSFSEDLLPLDQALLSVIEADGPQVFSLVERRRVATRSGREGSLDEEGLEIRQRVVVDQVRNQIQADVHVHLLHKTRVHTELALKPDTFAVLAQADGSEGNLYVIVKPSIR